MPKEYYCETCDEYHTVDAAQGICELDYSDFVEDDEDDDFDNDSEGDEE